MKVYVQIGTNNGNDLFRQKVLNEKPDMVVLVEPLPFLIPEIQQNYSGIQNVVIINKAIHYENNKKINLYKPCIGKIDGNISENGIIYGDGNYSLLPMNDWGSKENMKEVEATTINFNTLCDDLYINSIEYLQIDTEGFDTEIIKMIDFSRININIIRYEKWGFNTDCFTRHNDENAAQLGKQGMMDVEIKLRSLGYSLQDIRDSDGDDILATKI
jgi:FkbM family methyltransferase